jgi:hypothetical protein
MSTFAATAAFILIVLAPLVGAVALIIKCYRTGSLQADVRWAVAYIRTEFAHWKYSRQN